MSDTIRETIIKDFMARLAVITTANGYNTDIGTTVLRAQKTVGPEDLPCCVVWPQQENSVPSYGENDCTMPIRIEGLAEFWSSNPSAISEQILGDLKKCIFQPANTSSRTPSGWTRSPDYIDSLAYSGGGTDSYPEEGQKTVGASLLVEVGYTERIGDPYSQ
ncbi:hypothetical protein SAMN04489760_14216 [Syntrophus gentianae]|uniref:Uncharacterized protein n=1 Tax=Syntrophus gentianae TaxID=43775 RepID=A0A1H8AXG4_9BACT|nr:hypothetical protein [Syntrophus gentianae]SEM75186.1 hypothetical protein SAMN04489760_14216 [Syntrophus gentianae]